MRSRFVRSLSAFLLLGPLLLLMTGFYFHRRSGAAVPVGHEGSTVFAAVSASTNFTFNHTNTAGTCLTVAVYVRSTSNPVVTVTYNAASMTEEVREESTTSDVDVWAFSLGTPATGSNVVDITLTASDAIHATATSWTNADAADCVDGANIQVGQATSGTGVSLAVTSQVNGMVFDAGTSEGGKTNIAIGPGQTSIFLVENVNNMDAFGSYEIGAASVTMSWTWDSAFSDWVYIALPINPQ